MDLLIKNNIMKRNKIIVDVGTHTTKILDVHYASKEIYIKEAKNFESNFVIVENGIDYDELARKVDMFTSGNGRRDISITLPDFLVESKIVQIKNKKESDIDKVIKKEYMHFGKVSPITHVVDYAFLGKREEAGDTVRYYLISAIQKSVATELVNAFSEYRMKITTISCGVYNQYCLSELYFNEYEHLNRLLIDFGTKNIRITAFSQGVAVYTRTIDSGFDTYVTKLFETIVYAGKPDICEMLYSVGEKLTQTDKKQKNNMNLINDEEYLETINVVDSHICNEIKRVIDLCANNDVVISKIYYTGFVINGFDEVLERETGINTEKISFSVCDEKSGRGYVLFAEDEMGIKYSNALGMAIYPML